MKPWPRAWMRLVRRAAQVGALASVLAAVALVARTAIVLSKPALPDLGPHQPFRHGRFWSAVPKDWSIDDTPEFGGVQFHSPSLRVDGVVWIQRFHRAEAARNSARGRAVGRDSVDVRERMAPLTGLALLAARSTAPGFVWGGHDDHSTVVRVEVAAAGSCADFVIDCDVAWQSWQEMLPKPTWGEVVDWCLRIPPTIRETIPCP